MKWNAACTIHIVNQLYVSPSFAFYAKKGKKPYRWGCVETKLLERKYLLGWKNRLVKKHFKLTGFSLRRTLAEIPAFVSIIS